MAGFQIGFEDGFIKIACANKAACVHIYGGHGLGRVYDEVAAKFQIHTRMQGAVDFFFYAIGFKQRTRAIEFFDFGDGIVDIHLCKLEHGFEVFIGIHQNALGIVAEHVAQHPTAQWQILIKQGFRRRNFTAFADVFPQACQVINIGL